jgi:hypothetical protein
MGVKTIITFTDGGDNNSDNPQSMVTDIQDSKILRFAIGVKGKDYDKNALKDIASSNKYVTVAKNYKNLENAFNDVAGLVSNVYRIRYLRSDQKLDDALQIKFKFQLEKVKHE